jgi:hypothetical protein
VCVRTCVRACVRVYVCVCDCVHVCVREREKKRRGERERGDRGGEGEREEGEREGRERERNATMQKERSKIDWIVGRGWEETASTCTSRTAVKAQLGRVCHHR